MNDVMKLAVSYHAMSVYIYIYTCVLNNELSSLQ